jgi:hypothetical protein
MPATAESPTPPRRRREAGGELRATGLRVPSTAVTLSEWASLWVKMCSDPESGLGPLNDDDVRVRYGLRPSSCATLVTRQPLARCGRSCAIATSDQVGLFDDAELPIRVGLLEDDAVAASLFGTVERPITQPDKFFRTLAGGP